MNTSRWILLAALAAPALQGCFPVVATGVVVGALAVADRRTTGTQVEDEGIELRSANRLHEKYGSKNAASVVSFNRRALIYGQAPSDAVRAEIEALVRGVPNVKDVVNEVQVAGSASLGTQSNDAVITTKVKASLAAQNAVPANAVKVVTERGTVYLMGLVSEREGEQAAKLAAGVAGVAKVVKVFEYITDGEVKRLGESATAAAPGNSPRP